ncbi:hypothetical protein [Methylobacter tundripaludum]|nr:hypothetical protein [Methylobacter tundripaludum]
MINSLPERNDDKKEQTSKHAMSKAEKSAPVLNGIERPRGKLTKKESL